MHQKPSARDLFFLGCFVVLITYQPYLYTFEFNFLETGIHLPALNALFNGAVAFRDVFYLRGPLELYVPYFMMMIFGKQAAVLPLFYYLFSVITVLLYLVLAKNLFKTRFILYLMIPVFIARTFPVFAFRYWGGLRYALAVLCLLTILFFFKTQKRRFLFLSGVVSSFGFLTTSEAGVLCIAAVISGMAFSWIFKIQPRDGFLKLVGTYCAGISLILIPYGIYLLSVGAFFPFIDSFVTIMTKMTSVFVTVLPGYPENIGDYLLALIPGNKNFKIMTPMYCYLLFGGYMFIRIKQKKLEWKDAVFASIVAYGLILFYASFRKLGFKHFEMALQPEKVLLFVMVEEAYLFLLNYVKSFKASRKEIKKLALKGFIYFLFLGLFMSSMGYSAARYARRFPMWKYVPARLAGKDTSFLIRLGGQELRPINILRAQGLILPAWQADEIEAIVRYIQKNTKEDEVVFTYPEIGSLNFLFDRPFVGRFPLMAFSWNKPQWRQETFDELVKTEPPYVVMGNLDGELSASDWYFLNPRNKVYFDETTNWILSNYRLIEKFKSLSIYKRKR